MRCDENIHLFKRKSLELLLSFKFINQDSSKKTITIDLDSQLLIFGSSGRELYQAEILIIPGVVEKERYVVEIGAVSPGYAYR